MIKLRLPIWYRVESLLRPTICSQAQYLGHQFRGKPNMNEPEGRMPPSALPPGPSLSLEKPLKFLKESGGLLEVNAMAGTGNHAHEGMRARTANLIGNLSVFRIEIAR